MYMYILYVYINVHNICIYRDICRDLHISRFKILIKSRKIRKSFIFSLITCTKWRYFIIIYINMYNV